MINLDKYQQTTENDVRQAIINDLCKDELQYTAEFLAAHHKSINIIAGFTRKSFHLGNSSEAPKNVKKQLLNPQITRYDSKIASAFLKQYVNKLSENDLLDLASLNTKYNMQKTLQDWVLSNYFTLYPKYDNELSLNNIGIKLSTLSKQLLANYDSNHQVFNNPINCETILNTYKHHRISDTNTMILIKLINKSFFERDKYSNKGLFSLLMQFLAYDSKLASKLKIELPISLLADVITYIDKSNRKVKSKLPITLIASSSDDVDYIMNLILSSINDDTISTQITYLFQLGVVLDTSKVKKNIAMWYNALNTDPLTRLSIIDKVKQVFTLIFNL